MIVVYCKYAIFLMICCQFSKKLWSISIFQVNLCKFHGHVCRQWSHWTYPWIISTTGWIGAEQSIRNRGRVTYGCHILTFTYPNKPYSRVTNRWGIAIQAIDNHTMYRVAFKIGENTAVPRKHPYDAGIKIWTIEHDSGERFVLAVSKFWSSRSKTK